MTTSLGTAMAREMGEQPTALAGLVDRLDEISNELQAHEVSRRSGLAILARGSSDNAARVAAYSALVRSGRPVHQVSPSVYTAFGQSTDPFGSWVVLAVSQSGRTPEVVDLAVRFRASGALVVAVTNDPTSDLAAASDVHVALEVGDETAVPATKTVTAQILATATVAAAMGDTRLDPAALQALPDQVRDVLDDETGLEQVIEAVTAGRGVCMTGRAFSAAAAFESALKLQETTGIMAHAFSTADFRHGPIRLAAAHLPVLAFAGSSPADRDTDELIIELRQRGTAPLVVGSGAQATLTIARSEPEIEALLATVRGQQVALHAARHLGLDPDIPAGLSKVTLTD